jgi:hypothetical protein
MKKKSQGERATCLCPVKRPSTVYISSVPSLDLSLDRFFPPSPWTISTPLYHTNFQVSNEQGAFIHTLFGEYFSWRKYICAYFYARFHVTSVLVANIVCPSLHDHPNDEEHHLEREGWCQGTFTPPSVRSPLQFPDSPFVCSPCWITWVIVLGIVLGLTGRWRPWTGHTRSMMVVSYFCSQDWPRLTVFDLFQ